MNKGKQRVGILGGTFNPIHIGHMAIAQTALERCRLDQVVFVPAAVPPHKRIARLAPADHRLQMVRLAVRGNPAFTVSDFEIRKGGKSYTIDTVRHFQTQYPEGTRFFFIIGEDNVEALASWRDIEKILQIVTFVVASRPGFEDAQTRIRHQAMVMPGMEISSSYLRKGVTQGKSIKYLVPEMVLEYIEKNHLYRD